MSILNQFVNHVVSGDVRRHRLLLAAWLVVVIAATIVDGVRPIVTAQGLGLTVGILSSLLSLTKFLLLLVLIPAVVHTHPLVGSDAFWMTRPIPPRTLLVAKAMLLGIVTVVLPVVAEAVLMASYAVPLRQIVAVAVQNALYGTLWTILLVIAAALTPNLARFALLCGGALAALALVAAAMLAVSMATLEDAPPMSGGSDIGDPTPGVVMTLLAIVAGLALLGVQYRTRSRMRSVAVGSAALVLAYFAASAWPWPILAPRLAVPAWTAADSTLRLSADADTVQIKEETSPFSQRTSWTLARARVSLGSIEPNWTADVGVLQATLRVDGGTRLESVGTGHPTATPVEGREERPTITAVRHLLGVERLADVTPPHREPPVIFCQRDADFRRLAPTTGTYQGRFRVVLTRHHLDAALPLQRGAAFQDGAYRFAIEGVERTSASVSILARESDARSIFDRQPTSVLSYYLRNSGVSEAVAGAARDDHGPSLFMFLPFSYGSSANRTSGFSVRSLVLRFPEANGRDAVPLSIDDAWFQGAELVLVRATREGSVERTLDIGGFPLRNF